MSNPPIKLDCDRFTLEVAVLLQAEDDPYNRNKLGQFAPKGTGGGSKVNKQEKVKTNANLKEAPPAAKPPAKNPVASNKLKQYQKIMDAIDELEMESEAGDRLKDKLKGEVEAAMDAATNATLKHLDSLLGESDLASADPALRKVPASERLARLAEDSKEILEDTAVLVSAGILGTLEKLVEADTGRDIKTIKEVQDEVANTAKTAANEEKGFLASQFKGIKAVANRVTQRVVDYQKERLKKSEERRESVKAILKYSSLSKRDEASKTEADKIAKDIKDGTKGKTKLPEKSLAKALASPKAEENINDIVKRMFSHRNSSANKK